MKLWWQNEKHTKFFHECKRKDDESANNDDQVVSIQEPLSKTWPAKQMKKNQYTTLQKNKTTELHMDQSQNITLTLTLCFHVYQGKLE